MKTATPLLWAVLCCEWWGMSKEAAIRIWEGFAAAQYSVPSQFRQWFLYQPRCDIAAFQHAYSPRAVVGVLRELVAEQRITFAQANLVIEGLLTRVNSEGQWKA